MLDLFRLVLLSLIVVSWMVVMSVGGLLILQSYGQEVGDGAPFADQAKTVFDILEDAPPEQRQNIIEGIESRFFDVTLVENVAEPSPSNLESSRFTFDFVLPGAFAGSDSHKLNAFQAVATLIGARSSRPKLLSLELLLTDGTQVQFRLAEPFKRRDALLRRLFYLFLVGSTIITLAMIGVFRLGNPMGRFKEAALRLSEDIESPPLDETRGVAEVRAVSKAMNAMQQRVKDYLAERTTMLAAISHDIRTGLFRLRMRSEKLE
ncbi:MAG: hypothetical protein ACPG4M_06395, partial [Alphaproteobacteria bacterium]